jgi:hypothetical protein
LYKKGDNLFAFKSARCGCYKPKWLNFEITLEELEKLQKKYPMEFMFCKYSDIYPQVVANAKQVMNES